jgi:hypothetical protein
MNAYSKIALASLTLGLVFFAVNPAIAFAWHYQPAPADTAQAQRISQLVAAQDWLGPISSIALSPFFGLACLSGIATYGPDWIRNSPLVSVSGPLNNPVLFWIMLILTFATSLPRWTKLSKPIAMGLEKIEAYSAIIILIAIRFAANASDASTGTEIAATGPVLYEAGVLSLPLEALLSLAMAINLIVVNTVKLVVDFLIWLTPVPSIDLVLEAIGKLITASLIGLYAFSPTLTTVINLCLFVLCSFVFFASKRAIVYFKEIYIRPTIAKVLRTPSPATDRPTVFLANGWNGYPRRTRGKIILNPDGKASKLILTRWFTTREFELKEAAAPPTIRFLSDTLRFDTSDGPVNLEAQKGVFALNDTNASMPIPQGA